MISILSDMGKGARQRYIENLRNFSFVIPWKDFEYIMIRHFGFEMDKKKGSSARTFSRKNETFTANDPHGRRRVEKNISKADRRKAIKALIRLGLIRED